MQFNAHFRSLNIGSGKIVVKFMNYLVSNANQPES